MRCDRCGQALPEMRLGVRLTPFKARLFDLVRRGGIDGIHSNDLYSLLYRERGSSRHTLKAHVWQINELIADEGYRIEGHGSFYRLVNIRKRAISKLRSIPLIGATSKHASLSACGPKYERR
jgi:hypothetical protein